MASTAKVRAISSSLSPAAKRESGFLGRMRGRRFDLNQLRAVYAKSRQNGSMRSSPVGPAINGLETHVPLGQQVDRIFSKCRPDRVSRWRFVYISLSKPNRSP